MSDQPENPPAFPSLDKPEAGRNMDGKQFYVYSGTPGMTLRDYFAAAALQGWLSSFGPNDPHPATSETNLQAVASGAYAMADAMLKARQP